MLAKVGIIKLDYELLIVLLIGILIGALVFGLALLIIYLMTHKKKIKIIKSDEEVSYDDCLPIIEEYTNKYHTEISSVNDIAKIFDIVYNMSEDIASLFFPKSKNPLLELSIDEVIKFAQSFADSFDNAIYEDKLLKKIYTMDSKVLNMFFQDGIKISTLYGLKDKKIEISSELKEAKENVFSKLKKHVVDKIKGIGIRASVKYLEGSNITERICMLLINVCAAETYQAFSHKLYNKEVDIDTSIADENIEIIEEEKEL